MYLSIYVYNFWEWYEIPQETSCFDRQFVFLFLGLYFFSNLLYNKEVEKGEKNERRKQ